MNRLLFKYFPLTVNNPFLFFYLKALNMCFKLFKKKNISDLSLKKILFVHLGHLGDIILVLKCIHKLKQEYPFAQIGVLSGSWNQEALEGHPDIHFLHYFDHVKNNRTTSSVIKKLFVSWNSFFTALKDIAKARYDVSIDCSLFYPNSHLLCYLADIPTRIGYMSGGAGALLNKSLSLTEEIIPIERELLRLLESFVVFNHVVEEHEQELEQKKDLWIFHPYSGDKKKNLGKSFWEILHVFFTAHGKEVVFTGKSTKEKEAIDAMLGGKNLESNLCGKHSFHKVSQLAKQAEGIVCVDTFIGHLAAKKNSRIFVQFNHPLHMIRWCPEHAYSMNHRKESSYENDHFSRWVWDKTF